MSRAIIPPMTPSQRYQDAVASGRITADPEQERIVAHFDALQQRIEISTRKQKGTVWGRLFGSGPAQLPVQGLYLWGGVGRGKTFVMDLFFESLTGQDKLRTHFHRFMQQVHQGLTRYQGHKDPLESVADELASEVRVLCFDEFFVLDIGDAMILAGLLKALFRRGIVLVTTSNLHPDGLYENGLQRERFLPAIALLKQHTAVVEMASGTDYRLRSLSQARLYHSPVDEHTEAALRDSFRSLATDELDWREDCSIDILNREIATRHCAGDVVWFDFAALCGGPRSAQDYVELARLFHAIIVSDIPALDDRHNDQARRFINLVDALYDRRVKLIISAAVKMELLYTGQALAFEFQRTHSRLVEMQSRDYLGQRHYG